MKCLNVTRKLKSQGCCWMHQFETISLFICWCSSIHRHIVSCICSDFSFFFFVSGFWFESLWWPIVGPQRVKMFNKEHHISQHCDEKCRKWICGYIEIGWSFSPFLLRRWNFGNTKTLPNTDNLKAESLTLNRTSSNDRDSWQKTRSNETSQSRGQNADWLQVWDGISQHMPPAVAPLASISDLIEYSQTLYGHPNWILFQVMLM